MIEVRLRDEAVDDILTATAWYEFQRADLGIEFAVELDVALERIVGGPEKYARQYGEVRRVLLRRFPYAVYFVIDENIAHVLAVLHQRQSPAVWRGRGDT
ncbi:MAG: type II toxin-antitoxin system RelE/ParE family toxin [Gammaproteobacteria bacterium]|nr:type II toxin-antitoxin system RelE/ParE family toxin [Gammaproteobacteria bacterium]